MEEPNSDSGAPAKEKKKRTRSPAYPFIDLETAIERAKQFYDREQQHAANIKVAVKHWDYEEKSSGGLQTAAALVAFGLMRDEGTRQHRKLQLTPEAIRILLSPSQTEREAAIRDAALAPPIHRQIWQRWDGNLPSEESLKFTLLTEWKPRFNANAVDGFIKQFNRTISFAKLSESDSVGMEDGNSGPGKTPNYVPRVGDYIQWYPQGVAQFQEPKRIRGVSTDGLFVFVEGSSTGLPAGETKKEDSEKMAAHHPGALLVPKSNVQEDVYSLPEGRVVVQWPAPLSAESIQELKDYLKLLERKITRSQAKEKQTEPQE